MGWLAAFLGCGALVVRENFLPSAELCSRVCRAIPFGLHQPKVPLPTPSRSRTRTWMSLWDETAEHPVHTLPIRSN